MNELEELRAQLGSFVEQPHIVLELHIANQLYVHVRVHNVGPGAALNAALELSYIGVDPEDSVTHPLTIPTLLAGQHYDFYPPFGGFMKADEPKSFVHRFTSVALFGKATDVDGTVMVRHKIVDLQAWFDNMRGAEVIIERHPWADAPALLKKLVDHVGTIAGFTADQAAEYAWMKFLEGEAEKKAAKERGRRRLIKRKNGERE